MTLTETKGYRPTRVQEKGQITLPQEIREALGIKKGDFVAFELLEGAVMLKPAKLQHLEALTEIGKQLGALGINLDDLIESSRKTRKRLVKKKYGHLINAKQ
jgi:AbrB family looped-hinge helix DNA binding protein